MTIVEALYQIPAIISLFLRKSGLVGTIIPVGIKCPIKKREVCAVKFLGCEIYQLNKLEN